MLRLPPEADHLPLTANHYQWRGKPAAVVPGRFGVIYEPAPRDIPWSELIQQGTPISAQQFQALLYAQE